MIYMAKRERGVFLVWTKVFQEVLKTTFQLKIHFPVDKNAFSSYCEIVQTNFMIMLSVTIVTCETKKKHRKNGETALTPGIPSTELLLDCHLKVFKMSSKIPL